MARPYAGTLTERPLPSVHLQRRSPAPRKGTIMSTATSTASAATADKVPFSDLAGALRGPLITAADTEYDTARASTTA